MKSALAEFDDKLLMNFYHAWFWCTDMGPACTKTQCDKNSSTTYHKIRQGQISWRTHYKRIYAEGLFKDNKIRKKKGGSRIYSTSQYNYKNCCILIVVEQQIDSWIRVLPLISTL